MGKNLPNGSVLKNIAYFSLPYLLSYFLQTLYGLADLFIIGQFEGVASTNAESIGRQVMHMLPVMIWYVNIMPMAVLILSCLVIMCFSCAAIRILKLCSSVPTVISVSLKNMLLRVELPVTAVWVSIRHWSMPSP